MSVLDAHLLHRTYLVGDQITCADISIASALLYPFKLTCDKNYLKNYPNVTRWFTTCVNQPEFAAVVGTVVLCKKELLAAGQTAAPAAAVGKATKKEKAPKDAPAAEAEMDEPIVVEKKAEHPYKIMDKEHPSAFSMDAWKKTYSNAASYAEAMTVFWETFDSNGWTLWLQTYNYNEDNKRIFMTANAIGGFQQRTDEIRKWAFGVQDVSQSVVLQCSSCCFGIESMYGGGRFLCAKAYTRSLFLFRYTGLGNRRDTSRNYGCLVAPWRYRRAHDGRQ